MQKEELVPSHLLVIYDNENYKLHIANFTSDAAHWCNYTWSQPGELRTAGTCSQIKSVSLLFPQFKPMCSLNHPPMGKITSGCLLTYFSKLKNPPPSSHPERQPSSAMLQSFTWCGSSVHHFIFRSFCLNLVIMSVVHNRSESSQEALASLVYVDYFKAW